MRIDDFFNLVQRAYDWIERQFRLLENHRDFRAADRLKFFVAERKQIFASKADGPAHDSASMR
jgi:hypothetical protein